MMNSRTMIILGFFLLLLPSARFHVQAQEASKCVGALDKDLKNVMARKSLVVNCTIKQAKEMPSQPTKIKGWEYKSNQDYWGSAFKGTGEIRVFDDGKPQSVLDCMSASSGCIQFPATQNSCSSGIFILRWRSMNPDVQIAATTQFAGLLNKDWKEGTKGYLIGTNCHAPLFKFHSVSNKNGSSLADIRFDVRMWRPGLNDTD